MNIAFDAKRAYQNNTGLGNYSRTLISSLATYFPQHSYYLYAPKLTTLYQTAAFSNMESVLPEKRLHRWFRSAWRSKYVVGELAAKSIDIYHGLSHEIPFGIHTSGVKSVVTMHDLIFERYPGQYNPIDVQTYRRKAKYACQYADKIIAISEQTKQDIIHYYKIPAEKIEVVYQSCDESFAVTHDESQIRQMKAQYGLPESYFLYVGSIIERKNLMGIIHAMLQLKGDVDLPLVVLGGGSSYKKKVKAFVERHGIADRIIWLNEKARLADADLPLLYQGAEALIYPSIFEGFGIPILEALWSRTPVITSAGSCFGETGGDAALYVNPLQPPTIADAMRKILREPSFAATMRTKGWAHAQLFSREKCAAGVMKVYESL
ncbi:glycosyltransferase family 4 protein [Chitinophaga pinensis]|uniref:Glycosyl transferase group 1 n=1 Tax=Chitinophaga pinensis (strain ATCC 43595 / DSM 2588 / LMG 13176 / NBRC 15968 / NCIMB 11800 / UQM 2034) TaxID=485918 RepID=A0A979G9W3_CHIPD|nr:glycosyltransferase family 1 protein [Chitinophaga pinensis]ACU63377.1 glycosyl transferase group 1 [Chitinophaga pinensis DSM 2588]